MTLDVELQEVLRRYCSSLGTTFISKGSSKVLAQPSNQMLFAKTGSIDQVLGEAESLQAMFRASQLAGHSQPLIPTIHAFGKTPNGKKAFLVTDYRDLSSGLSRSNQRILGTKLAQMHRHGTSENGLYGFDFATHCGATEQDNTWTASWSDFWADRRIGDLVHRSGDRELAALEVQLREKVYPLLFNKESMKDVRPAIIHGDLWSGNAGTDKETGQPIIFDPSSSYSHNEAELGITKMFGGFGNEFYEAYHEVIPKAEPYYNERQDMYEAYHHLNHFVIFGGGYRSGTIRLFKKLISWAEKEGQKGNSNDNDDGSDSRGDGKGSRGLRGGATLSEMSSTSALQGCSSALVSQSNRQPPPNDGAAAVPTMTSINGHADAAKEVVLPPATPSQIADYFSQMICYLWFSSGIPGHSLPTTPSRSPSITHQPLQSSPLAPRRYGPAPFASNVGVNSIRALRPNHAKTASAGNITTGPGAADISASFLPSFHPAASSPTTIAFNTKLLNEDPMLLRLQPKSRFLRFCREILRTTQLSTSVIALALIYVHRLKEAHPQLKGKDGSEFRLAISSLMLANKILDDNTYLNKTWAEISGMPLIEISKMEVEFWLGLKMELHITKDQYEKELQDLHTLANDRNLAVQQRDAAMKKAVFLQQQQQQRFQVQQIANQRNQWMPFLQSSSHIPSGVLINDARYPSLANQTATRHSIASVDETLRNHTFPETFLPIHPFQTQPYANLPAYDVAGSVSGYNNMQSPPYYSRPTSFTLPPSPLSQASAGITLNSGDCGNLSLAIHAALQDPLAAPSPSLNVNGNGTSLTNDPVWSSIHQQGNAAANSMLPQYTEVSPKSGASNVSFTFGDQSMATVVRKCGTSIVDQRPSLSTQSSSTLSGLKRDFEKTNLESASPLESSQHPNKRFAAEPIMSDDLRSYQLTPSSLNNSAANLSPIEGRYALRSRSRALEASKALESSRSVSRDASSLRGACQMSVSPHHAPSFSEQTSLTSISRGSIPSRPSTSYDDQSRSTAPHPNYHSVFSSALTPNALAAPLDNSIMYQQATQWNDATGPNRKVGPLQYYSLAAGEPYGTIGTYLPPPYNRQGWNAADSTSGMGGRRSSMVPDCRFVSNGQPRWNDSDMSWNRTNSNLHTPLSAPGLQGDKSNQTSYSMAPPPPSSEMQHQSKDDLMSLYQSQPHGVGAPFSLDVHSWPLANSASSNFLFPYHLLPPHPQALQNSIPPLHHHRQSHHYHHHT